MTFSSKRMFAVLIATLALVGAYAMPVHAQATRTWISGVGDDANPCSRTAPCKTFAGAISKTAAGGEINCLDPGGFGALTITKAITLRCDSVEGGVLVAGTDGIAISAGATDVVELYGLDIYGLGSGLNGVNVHAAGIVRIVHCHIQDFTQAGVYVEPSSGTVFVFVQDTLIGNTKTGVKNVPSGTGAGRMSLDAVTIIGQGNPSSSAGVSVSGANASVSMNNSAVLFNNVGLFVASGGQIISWGNNRVRSQRHQRQPDQRGQFAIRIVVRRPGDPTGTDRPII